MQSSDCESNINFGAIIYNRRVAIGWKRSVLAAEYGRALDESIQEETIKAMEERNSVPMKHRKRRAILAALLHLPPAALGLTVLERLPSIRLGTIEVGQSLDLRAYHVKLKDAWENGAVWSIDMVEDVVKSIVCLQHGKGDRKEVTRLLCGYNTLAGDTFSELGFLDTSLMYHDNAITLANESKNDDLLGFGHWGRASSLSDWGQHEAALQDLRQAKAIGKKLPGQLNGYVTSNLSEELSFMAQNKDEFQEVTDLACEAETFISQDDTLDDYTMHFNKVRYILNLSSALVASPNVQLHEPDEAIHLIEKEVPFFDDTRSAQYRQSHCNIVLARANMAKRDYAYATKLLADSVAIMQEVHSKLHLVEIESLYRELRQTPYKNSVEVARLNLALMQLKHPELFVDRRRNGQRRTNGCEDA